MSAYQSYCKECEQRNVINPYKDEVEFNKAYGISNEKTDLFDWDKHIEKTNWISVHSEYD